MLHWSLAQAAIAIGVVLILLAVVAVIAYVWESNETSEQERLERAALERRAVRVRGRNEAMRDLLHIFLEASSRMSNGASQAPFSNGPHVRRQKPNPYAHTVDAEYTVHTVDRNGSR